MKIMTHKPGSAGVAQTVSGILGFAMSPDVRAARNIALAVTHGLRTDRQKAHAIYDWIVSRVDYVRDALHREHVQDPIVLLEEAIDKGIGAAGDCDCHATIVCSLLLSIGIPCRVVVSENVTNRGSKWNPLWAHVWAEALVESGQYEEIKTDAGTIRRPVKKWLALDTSMGRHKGVPIGTRPPGRHSFIYPSDIPPHVIEAAYKRYSTDKTDSNLGFVESVITAGSGIVQSAIGKRIADKQAKVQERVQQAFIASQQALEMQQQGLDAERKKISDLRDDQIAMQSSFARVVTENRRRNQLIMLGVISASALLAWSMSK